MIENTKLICFYGPESTGKTSMAIEMAKRYQTAWVPEVAREIITSNEFSLDDIVKIGEAQTQRVFDKLKIANNILFCDSDVITTQIYSQHYLNEVPKILFDLETEIKYDLYFLFDIDTKWVADGLRDLGHKREEMFIKFKQELDDRDILYQLVSGDWASREEIIMNTINQKFGIRPSLKTGLTSNF
jgi:HTH-type transcriptional regulator, transcriptional repressor of NAD biosynthesis genes